MAALGARIAKHPERRRRTCDSNLHLPLTFLFLYAIAFILYLHVLGSFVNPAWQHHSSAGPLSQPQKQKSTSRFGYASINVTSAVAEQQRVLCRYRADAARTIVVHMHIPKSGGTAFAMALKSECRCVDIPRPQKGYCKECPHILPTKELPVTTFTQNLWTEKNESFYPPYAERCRRFNASSRWYGFSRRNRAYTFYSQSRLTSGWPCGVHVGYARLRECFHRLQLPGVKHVVVTLFREPLARFVSEFYQAAYNRLFIESWDWCMNRTEPVSMKEFFAMPVSFPFQCRMTKLLAGSPVQTGAAGEDWRKAGIRKRDLERALGVVRSTEDFVFGLAEELELTLDLFQFVFKRSFKAPSSCHSHQNKTGCRKVELGLHDLYGRPLKLSGEEVKMFEANNREDQVVYDTAAELFWKRVEAMRSLQTLGSDMAIDRRCDHVLKGDL